jgi:hypothetical protein
MARITITRTEIHEELLPGRCMACGEKAVVRKSKNFSWHPPWVIALIFFGLLPWAIVAIIMTKRMTVEVPLCERHKRYWFTRNLIIYVGLGLVGLIGLGSIVVMAALSERRRGPASDLTGMVCFGVVVIFLVWLLTMAILQFVSIRPTEITDRRITLTNVSQVFVDALEADRNADEEEEYDDRPRRPPSRPARSDEDDRFRERR